MRATTILAAALLAAGCASTPPAVLDADYGRLRPEQATGVDAARAELARAHEEVEAAKAKNAEARREQKLAEDDIAVARRELDRVKALGEAAEARRRAADAHADYAEKLADARKAAEEAAQRRVELSAAKVELLKLQALEQAKLKPSQEYDEKAFYTRVADSQKELDSAKDRVKRLEQETIDCQRKWDEASRRVPATQQ